MTVCLTGEHGMHSSSAADLQENSRVHVAQQMPGAECHLGMFLVLLQALKQQTAH